MAATFACKKLTLSSSVHSSRIVNAIIISKNLNGRVILRSLSSRSEDDQQQTDITHPRPDRPSSARNMADIKRVEPKQFELSFEEYIKLKNSLKTRKNIAGLPFAALGLGTSSVVSAYMFPEMFDATPENVQLIMGLDPLVFCGISGVISAGIGFAAGTQLFRVLWGILNKSKANMLLEREKDFLERIQSKRFASFSKFEDDYYGESIKNLSDYRQWLRTQQKKAARDEKFTSHKAKEDDNEIRTA